VKGQWEERFERRFGFWRSVVDEQVMRYLDCGLYENGFARIRCPECAEEYLLAFSCKTRELCPSCAAKRSAAMAGLLAEDVLAEVGHAQWVFVIPKMLRPYFLHHRELLGWLARVAWETVLELMCAVAGKEGMRPGMIAVVQTAGDLGNWHPHVHALVSRGGCLLRFLSLMPVAADCAGCARGGGFGVRNWGSRALCRVNTPNWAVPPDSKGRSTRASSRRGSKTPLNGV